MQACPKEVRVLPRQLERAVNATADLAGGRGLCWTRGAAREAGELVTLFGGAAVACRSTRAVVPGMPRCQYPAKSGRPAFLRLWTRMNANRGNRCVRILTPTRQPERAYNFTVVACAFGLMDPRGSAGTWCGSDRGHCNALEADHGRRRQAKWGGKPWGVIGSWAC